MKTCILLFALAGAEGQDNKPPQHYLAFFVGAEDYKNSSIAERTAYVGGWLDSRLNAGGFGNARTIKAMRDCIGGPQGKTITQVTAVCRQVHPGTP